MLAAHSVQSLVGFLQAHPHSIPGNVIQCEGVWIGITITEKTHSGHACEGVCRGEETHPECG